MLYYYCHCSCLILSLHFGYTIRPANNNYSRNFLFDPFYAVFSFCSGSAMDYYGISVIDCVQDGFSFKKLLWAQDFINLKPKFKVRLKWHLGLMPSITPSLRLGWHPETQDLLQRELCGTPRLVPSPTPWSAVQTSSGTMCTSAHETLHSLLLLTLSSL